jgi:hypothetical protein
MQQAIDALRVFLSDGPTDKPVKGKSIVGPVNGTNVNFYTWDDRLVAGTLRVFVNDVDSTVTILDDDLAIGYFTLAAAPRVDSRILAQYFYQYFFDHELDTFLTQAASQYDANGNVVLLDIGLQLSCLHFAGFFAYQKLSMRWVERMTSRFLLQEAPVEADVLNRANLFKAQAEQLREEARRLRLDFYQQQGRRAQAAFGVSYPRIPRVGPRT